MPFNTRTVRQHRPPGNRCRGPLRSNLVTHDGQPALRFPCNFAGTTIERASWDRTVTLDLVGSRGIQFKMFCRDASPISHFSLYFQSGDGWYHAGFYPESSTDWNTITIDKADTGTEGKPAGWGNIRTIRLSAWRGKDTSTEFFLADLRKTGSLGADALVAIVRAESAAQGSPEEARSANQFAEATAENLQQLGVGYAVVSDLDLTAARLQPAKVVVLPYNPGMPDQVADILIDYEKHGGKLLAFYSFSSKLLPVLGLESAART